MAPDFKRVEISTQVVTHGNFNEAHNPIFWNRSEISPAQYLRVATPLIESWNNSQTRWHYELVTVSGAIENLRAHQKQLDFDGIEVGVSRQALDEVLDWADTIINP